MDWISILIMAAVGALSALIAIAIVGRSKERRVVYIVVFMVAFFALRLATQFTIVPKIQMWQAEREIQALPFYSDLKQDDPQMYEKLLAIVRDGIKQKEPASAIQARLAAVISSAVPRYMPRASDDSTVAFAQALTNELTRLHSSNPDTCYAMLFPDASNADSARQLSESSKDELLRVMGDVVHSAVHAPQQPPNPERAQQLLEPEQKKLAAEFGEDLQLLGKKPADAHERERVCAIATTLYSDVLNLPREDASTLMRYLIAK